MRAIVFVQIARTLNTRAVRKRRVGLVPTCRVNKICGILLEYPTFLILTKILTLTLIPNRNPNRSPNP